MSESEFSLLLETHQNIIHKVCSIYTRSAADHEDLFQEIVYQAYRSYHKFKGDSKVSTWLYRVSLYTALAIRRKKKVEAEQYRTEAHFEQLEDPKQNYLSDLYRLIDELKPTDKALILLYLDDRSYEEMADIMGLSLSNVGVRINRIKKKLTELWRSTN